MSTNENTATEKRDVYATVTAQIITAIENGVGNWRMPWHTSGRHAFSPINVTSHKPYRGINTVCLWAAAGAKGYESGEWGTYKQWQDRGAHLRHGGNQAYYRPSEDHIQMPPFQAFKENVSYYSTLAHEHTHWTGKAGRCDRHLGKRFGDHAYAAEELIAELGAAFTCAHLGLSTEPREDHAAYIQSWLE